MGLYRLSVVAGIESASGAIALAHQPRMMKHDDSIQQILSEFTVKLLASLLSQPQANVTETHSLRLIDSFEAIHERATLHCDAPGVVCHACQIV